MYELLNYIPYLAIGTIILVGATVFQIYFAKRAKTDEVETTIKSPGNNKPVVVFAAKPTDLGTGTGYAAEIQEMKTRGQYTKIKAIDKNLGQIELGPLYKGSPDDPKTNLIQLDSWTNASGNRQIYLCNMDANGWIYPFVDALQDKTINQKRELSRVQRDAIEKMIELKTNVANFTEPFDKAEAQAKSEKEKDDKIKELQTQLEEQGAMQEQG